MTILSRNQIIISRLLFVAAITLLVVLVVHGLRLVLTATDIETDTAFFGQVARALMRGDVLYRDIWDNKPPGVFLYMLPFVATFGSTITAANMAIATLDVLFGAAVAIVIYTVTRSGAGAAFGGFIACLYAMTTMKVESTVLMAVFSALAMACVIAARGRSGLLFIGGVLFACGVIVKQPLVVELPALLLAALVYTRGQRWRTVVSLSAGMALVALVCVGWLLSTDTLGLYWQHTVSPVGRYVFTSDGNWYLAEESRSLFNNTFLHSTLPQFAPLAGFALVSSVLYLRSGRPRTTLIVALVWLVLALGAAAVGRNFKAAYYMQAVPPLALLVVLGLPEYRRLWLPWVALVFVAFVATTLQFGQSFIRPLSLNFLQHRSPELIQFIRENTTSEDCLWTWGWTSGVTYLSDRADCAGTPSDGHVMDSYNFPIDVYRLQHMQNLLGKRPALLINDGTWGFFPELQKYADRYLGALVFDTDETRVYRVDRSMWHRTDAVFDDEVALVGYDLLPTDKPYCPGDVLTLAMDWQQLSIPTHEYQMFVQLLTLDEQARVAGYDGVPVHDRPTHTWVNQGEVLLGERFTLPIPAETAAGDYKLVAGLYDVVTTERAIQADGISYAIITILPVGDCPTTAD